MKSSKITQRNRPYCVKTQVPRGIRNNNPLNIRIGNDWQGERLPKKDKEFEEFTEMKYGIRAAAILLRNYIEKYKLNTVRKIVSRWAPSSENNTEAYIKQVCFLTGFRRSNILTADCATLYLLIAAMGYVETGTHIERDDILEGLTLANIPLEHYPCKTVSINSNIN